VVDLSVEKRSALTELLTVDVMPTRRELLERCASIAKLASSVEGARKAMVGGAPAMMRPLEDALFAYGIQAVFAFSKRESIDQPQPDGSVRKVAIFRHAGWWP
jgi:hypothetical protein